MTLPCPHLHALDVIRDNLRAQARDTAIMLPAGQVQPAHAVAWCDDCKTPVGLWRRLKGALIRPIDLGERPTVCCRCVPLELLAGLRVSHGYCRRHADQELAMARRRAEGGDDVKATYLIFYWHPEPAEETNYTIMPNGWIRTERTTEAGDAVEALDLASPRPGEIVLNAVEW